MEIIELTKYSHGAGCGCKISPKALSTILQTNIKPVTSPNLLVGNDTRDDAAVYDLGDGTGLISTTDFFLPIVDDPFDFGKIAATNAISDIYAMGGTPLMAIAILGWPVDKISEHVANRVIEGGRDVCKQAKIPLAGGHSIDNPEPLFGLAVTGRVDLNKLKRNDTAKEGCKLYLTKPLGVGILATAHIDGVIKPEHANIAPDSMMILNSVGKNMAEIEGVTAMTDVTGFGLLGHLIEMCEGSDLSASLEYDKIPVFEPAFQYIDKKSIPGGTKRNWESYGGKVILPDLDMRHILADAQTSGGLLIAVMPEDSMQVEGLLKKNGLYYQSIGKLKPGRKDCVIEVV